MVFKLSIIVLTLMISTEAYEICNEPGEIQGTLHDALGSNSYNACLRQCRFNQTCSCFTYHDRESECILYSDCTVIDPKVCLECYSGKPNCPELPECDVSGLCNGQHVGFKLVVSKSECLSTCKATEACKFYAFKSTGECILLKNCASVVNCSNCKSGPKKCGLSAPKGIYIFSYRHVFSRI